MKSAVIAALFGYAAATSWGDYPSFNTPKSNNNKCDGQQQSGWNWGNLGTGGFSNYDGFDFSGFECANSFGKRDILTKRDFQQKVIKGSMSDADGPSFKCGTGKDFSATKYDISVSRDTDVEMHYSMPDGTTCKQTASCKTGGTVVQNKQCGGAKEVKFKLPQGSKGGNCDLGIHDISFDCNPPPNSPPSSSAPPPAPPSSSKPAGPPSSSKPYTPPQSSSKPETPPPSSSKPETPPPSSSKPSEQPPASKPYEQPPSSRPGSPSSSSAPPPPPASSSTPGSPNPPPSSSSPPTPPPPYCGGGSGPYGNCTEPPPSSQPPQPPVSSSTPGSPNPPPSSQPPQPPASSSTPGSPNPPPSSKPDVPPPASSKPYEQPPSSSAPQPPPPSSSGPVVPPPSSSAPAPPSSSPVSPPPPPNNDCPSVLPQCLNTWIKDSGCKDNSDFQCYCKNGDFTKNVIQCVTAYGADSATVGKALSYLQGICAAFIPQNPGLVTDCPKDIPITPPAQVSTPAGPVSSGPSTTYTTQVVTETVSTCTPGQVVTDNGTPTTLSESKISTITITATNTITTCGGCQGGSGGYGGGAPVVPKYTTIQIADTYTVPCTYTEGVSQGYIIPGSSTITQLTTQVTVPLVQFTTAAPVQGQTTYSVGLADGPPKGGYNGGMGGGSGGAPQTTPVAPVQSGGGYGGGFGGVSTTVKPTSSKTGGPLQVTANAAVKQDAGALLGMIGAVAVLAL